MNTLFDSTQDLFPLLFDIAFKGLVILTAAGLVALCLKRAAAAQRHLIWALALGCLVLIPILYGVLPRWNLAVLPAERTVSDVSFHVDTGFGARAADGESQFTALASTQRIKEPSLPAENKTILAPSGQERIVESKSPRNAPSIPPAAGATVDPTENRTEEFPWTQLIVAVWIAGAVVCLFPFILGNMVVFNLQRKARQTDSFHLLELTRELCRFLAIGRSVRIKTSEKSHMPMTWGIFRPLLLLPRSLETWPEVRQRNVLVHELAHVKRWDCLSLVIARIALAVHWFNPLAWFGLYRMRIERERACDDLVLSTGSHPGDYADHLLEIVRSMRITRLDSAAAITIARPSHFEGRLLAVLDRGRCRRTPGRWPVSLAILLTVCVLLPLAMIRCTAEDVAKGDEPEVVETPHIESSGLEGRDPARSESVSSTTGRSGWSQYRGHPDHNNLRRVKNEIRVPKILWKIDRAAVPAVVGNDVYATGKSLRLVDLQNGSVKASWKPDGATKEINFCGTPVVLDDRVIANSVDGTVYALDRGLTRLFWTSDITGNGFFSGVSDGELYVVPGGNRLLAIDTDSGTMRWSKKFSRLFPVKMVPAIADGKVLFGSKNGVFYALDKTDGTEVWTYEANSEFGWTDPVVTYGKVFVGDRGGVINALDLQTGDLLWSRKSGAVGLSTPGIAPGSILVGFHRVVVPYQEKTGESDPRSRTFRTGLNPFGSPTLVGDTLYFGNLDGHLYAFNYETEKLEWAFETGPQMQVHDFVYHEGILLVSTTEGIYALGNDDAKTDIPQGYVLTSEI